MVLDLIYFVEFLARISPYVEMTSLGLLCVDFDFGMTNMTDDYFAWASTSLNLTTHKSKI